MAHLAVTRPVARIFAFQFLRWIMVMNDKPLVSKIIRDAVQQLRGDEDPVAIMEVIRSKYGDNHENTIKASKILRVPVPTSSKSIVAAACIDDKDQALAKSKQDRPAIALEKTVAYQTTAANNERIPDQPQQASKLAHNLPLLPSGYHYVRELASGAQGSVWLALNQNMGTPGRQEAVKILHRLIAKDMKRFGQEIQTLATLDHPNIVTIYYANAQSSFFIMEYLPGGTLYDFMHSQSFELLPGLQTLRIVAKALHFAHGKGLIHRDLKPQNILFSATKIPKITDFGIAKTLQSQGKSITMVSAPLGTPYYMSPEQWTDAKAVDHRCDIWALGVIMYEMLAGQLPFPIQQIASLMYAILNRKAAPPNQVNPNLSQLGVSVIPICMRALEIDEKKRYQSAGQMAYALENALKNYGRIAKTSGRHKKQVKNVVVNPRPEKRELRLQPQARAMKTPCKFPQEKKSPNSTRIPSVPGTRLPAKNNKKNTPAASSSQSSAIMVRSSRPKTSKIAVVLALLLLAAVIAASGYLLRQKLSDLLLAGRKTPVDAPLHSPTHLRQSLELLENSPLLDMNNERAIRQTLSAYDKLWQEHSDAAIRDKITDSRQRFQNKLEARARQEYNNLQQELAKRPSGAKPQSLKNRYQFLDRFPIALRRTTPTGQKLQHQLQKQAADLAEYASNERLNLLVNYYNNDKKLYRQALAVCDRILQYLLPQQTAPFHKLRQKIAGEYHRHIYQLETSYGQELRNGFHTAVLDKDFAAARRCCQKYRQERKFYGLWQPSTLLEQDLDYLQQAVTWLEKRQQKAKREGKDRHRPFADFIAMDKFQPKTAATRNWVLAVLSLYQGLWQMAEKYLRLLPDAPALEGATPESDWQKIQKQYDQAKGKPLYLDYIRAFSCYQHAQRCLTDRQFYRGRTWLRQIPERTGSQVFVRQMSAAIARLRQQIEQGYLDRYAVPLYFHGRFSLLPDASNGQRFTIHYPTLTTRHWQDFEILQYGCRHNNGQVAMTASIGLFEAYWKGRIVGPVRLEMSIQIPDNERYPSNLGFAVYKQGDFTNWRDLLDEWQNLDRYLCLLYFNAARLCQAEIHGKSQQNIPLLQNIEADIPFYGLKKSVICLTQGRPGTLPHRFVDEERNRVAPGQSIIKARQDIGDFARVKIAVTSSVANQLLFSIGAKAPRKLSCRRYKFADGYVGLYATSSVIFTKLTLSGRLHPQAVTAITRIVHGNQKKYLERPAYWIKD